MKCGRRGLAHCSSCHSRYLGESEVRDIPITSKVSQLVDPSHRFLLRRWWRGFGRRNRAVFLDALERRILQRITALDELCLHFYFLFRQRVDFRLERLIARERDLDTVISRNDLQRAAHALEFTDVPHETPIQKHGGTRGNYVNLHDGPGRGKGSARSLLDHHWDDQFLSRMNGDALVEILEAILAHGDRVIAGKKENLLVSFEFSEVADVLAIDPDAGSFFDFGFTLKLHFAHYFIVSMEHGRKQEGA